MSKVVLSFSGGCDSTTLLYKYLHEEETSEIYLVSLDYGQRHRKELEYARSHVEWLRTQKFGKKIKDHKFLNIDLRQFGNDSVLVSDNPVPDQADDKQTSTVVPYRNTLFMILVASQAKAVGASRVASSPVLADYLSYLDCRPLFFVALQNALRASGDVPDLVIETPFITWHKKDIISLGTSLGLDYNKTWTCYRGKEEPCGVCDSCQERVQSFYEASLIDPIYSMEDWSRVVEIYKRSNLYKEFNISA